MSIKFRVRAAALCVLIPFPYAKGAAENRFLFHTQEMPRVQIESNRVVGSVSGEAVEVELSKVNMADGPRLLISAAINRASLGEYSIMLERLPSIDLGSALYFAQLENDKTIKVELRFSEERECFVNDDGRDRLVIVFGEHVPEAYIIGYENCEPVVRTLEAE